MYYLQFESGHEEAGAAANRQAHEQLQSKREQALQVCTLSTLHPVPAEMGLWSETGSNRGCVAELLPNGEHSKASAWAVGLVRLEDVWQRSVLHHGTMLQSKENSRPSPGSARSTHMAATASGFAAHWGFACAWALLFQRVFHQMVRERFVM